MVFKGKVICGMVEYVTQITLSFKTMPAFELAEGSSRRMESETLEIRLEMLYIPWQ